MGPEINFITQNAAELAAAAGFIGGVVVDVLTAKRAADRHTGAMHTFGLTEEEYQARNAGEQPGETDETQAADKPKSSVFDTLRRPALPLAASLAAGLSVHAWLPSPVPTRTVRPIVEGVAQADNDSGVDGSAYKAGAALAGAASNVRLDILAANDGVVYPAFAHKNGLSYYDSTHHIEPVIPYGPSSLNDGLTEALQNADQQKSQGESAAVLLTENDTLLGDSHLPIEANVQAITKEAGGTKIDILNYPQGNSAAETELKDIAKATGGVYINGTQPMMKIDSQIVSALGPQQVKEHLPKQNNGIDKFLSILSVLATGFFWKERGRLKFYGRERLNNRRRKFNQESKGE